jgi:hypothetical protein
MDWLKRIFRRKPPLQLRHPLFGDITYSKPDGWINDEFTLWGFDGVELLIRANENGPTRIQEEALINFHAQQQDLPPRCLAEVDKVRRELEIASSGFAISGWLFRRSSQRPTVVYGRYGSTFGRRSLHVRNSDRRQLGNSDGICRRLAHRIALRLSDQLCFIATDYRLSLHGLAIYKN